MTNGEGPWRNRLYAADNLGVLRSLLDDRELCGKVGLVYIDPPFATGSVFESRNAEHAYEDGARGSQFLEFLRERLIVVRELLALTGSIYLHLDSKMAFPVKVIMDEVFGPAGFRNWITRNKSNRKNSGFLPEEREWLTRVFDELGWVDVYRRLCPATTGECYTWWSNRGQAYANNVGWRLDYHLATPALAQLARHEAIYKTEKFSDHAPITVDYELKL